ncbi:hypothetical protein HPP92_003916 [Vanilla planifolia]|uniref:BED-type domain-containing protein n=1 Tax=Vanilla planifolia TaxID=51239 RepID=A0A835VJF1_VANPL|nr:hypothetical protein HPP92_003916 [Vanilla planifolia]
MDMDDNEIVAEPLSALPNPRARRLRSLVWNDFTKRQKPDGNYEAICNHCGKKFTANSRSGTTHLRNHLNFCLSTRRADGRKRGRKPRSTSKAIGVYHDDKDGSNGFLFDQELSRQDLARMVIFHEYPFELVHHVGFKTFIRNLQPQFKLVSDEAIKADCMNVYESRRDKLSEVLESLPCRVSLTMERWCLSNGPEYLCLNCHYLDNDWKLQRKVLNLLHFGAPPSAEDISEEIMDKLHDWKISRKLSCMVLERSGDDQGAPSNLLLKVLRGTNSLLLNGDLFQFHGCVPALDAIVQDALLQIGDLCERVRSCVRFVKFSLEKMRRFENAAMLAESPRIPLVVDDNTSWSSALLMISTAYETRNAFKSLAEYDSDFSFPLTDQEWDDVKSVKECLETFDHMIKKFSGIRMPSANLFFIDICGILLLLKSWAVSPVLIVAKLASHMLKGFEEYWDANVALLAIASILDPVTK